MREDFSFFNNHFDPDVFRFILMFLPCHLECQEFPENSTWKSIFRIKRMNEWKQMKSFKLFFSLIYSVTRWPPEPGGPVLPGRPGNPGIPSVPGAPCGIITLCSESENKIMDINKTLVKSHWPTRSEWKNEIRHKNNVMMVRRCTKAM